MSRGDPYSGKKIEEKMKESVWACVCVCAYLLRNECSDTCETFDTAQTEQCGTNDSYLFLRTEMGSLSGAVYWQSTQSKTAVNHKEAPVPPWKTQ